MDCLRRPLLSTFLGGLALVVLGCPAVAPRAHGGASASTEPASPGLRVVHRGSGPASGVRLLGVDRAKRRAFVRIERRDLQAVAIETIDLDTGVRLDRWEATPAHARAMLDDDGDTFHPMSGTLRSDLMRFSDMVSASGPHVRSPRWTPNVVASDDGERVVFQVHGHGDSHRLFLAERGRKGARRVGQLASAYETVFSPDGRRLAFRGCESVHPAMCKQALYIAAVDADPIVTKRIEIPEARDIAWSANGRSIYALGDACLHRVDAETASVHEVFCSTSMTLDGFRLDPSGKTAVIAGMRGPIGAHTYDYAWIALPGGEPMRTHSLEGAVGAGLLSKSGILLAPLQGTRLRLVDLASAREATVSSSTWSYSDLDAQWIDDHTFVALRNDKDRFELVTVDARVSIDG